MVHLKSTFAVPEALQSSTSSAKHALEQRPHHLNARIELLPPVLSAGCDSVRPPTRSWRGSRTPRLGEAQRRGRPEAPSAGHGCKGALPGGMKPHKWESHALRSERLMLLGARGLLEVACRRCLVRGASWLRLRWRGSVDVAGAVCACSRTASLHPAANPSASGNASDAVWMQHVASA